MLRKTLDCLRSSHHSRNTSRMRRFERHVTILTQTTLQHACLRKGGPLPFSTAESEYLQPLPSPSGKSGSKSKCGTGWVTRLVHDVCG
eukprot:13907525-Alexandrium_andersonii.AAC.1